ncbi:LysR family transcriptional regulator [Nitratireductor kimnyeongensis]|uniref:LysR family transcriptional regulator n=2 Tax=Nitratireductor kimnyeongensis TaxID=430679 RepID=A0ABW0TA47_9HYPH|nr:LysR family transcriptional regulator [Nitratireductor kimnyeongensis]QZZ35476.1 LysR family transcriptional regulator [Nitratireductor kimnyeongensis]
MDLLRSFIVFQKVAELGSFSRAADALGIVPSAVSRQVSELEDWADLRLVNRTTRSLHLTPEGQIYLEKLSHITAEVQDLKSLGDTERSLTGHINLTTPIMLGQFILPETLARFKQANPRVGVSVSVINRMVDIVEEGFDVAVRAGNLSDSSLIGRKVGLVQISTVASPKYLQTYGAPKEPKDLTNHNCLSADVSSQAARWPFLVSGKEVFVKVTGDMRANESLCLKTLSLAGLGIIRLPRYYVSNELETGALVEVLPQNAAAPTPINIVYQSGRQNRPTLRAFIDFVAKDLRANSKMT